MRIHHLTLRGIGPFADEQHVDFDDLGQNGLFLLDGPTGVGKSTVVDAIVYALFGSPATDDGQDRMVSDFLGGDIPKSARPFVELTFSTSAGMYRIRREPKSPYVNRKGRADMHNASVRLSRVTNETADGLTLMSTSAPEVGNEVGRLLGLNREQVLSTIVLAQGQFARFLKARTEDRRAILQSVFNTGRYEQLQNALVDARKQAYAQREAGRRELGQAISAFIEASGFPSEAAEFTSDFLADPDAQVQVMDIHVAGLKTAEDELQQRVQHLQALAQQAGAALVDGQQMAQNITRKRDLMAQQAHLDQVQAEIDDLSEQLELASAAAVMIPSEQNMVSTQADLVAAETALESVLATLPAELRALTQDELDILVTTLVAQKAGLDELLGVESALPGNVAALSDLAEEIRRLEAENAEVSAELETIPARERLMQQDCDVLRELAASAPVAAHELQTAEQAAGLLAQVDRWRDAVVKAKQDATEALELAQMAEDALAAGRRRYRAGLAAELAGGLTQGDDCPVCGSPDHPRLAQPAADHVSADDLERLDTQWRRLSKLSQAAASDLAAKEAELHSAQARLTCHDREEANLQRKLAAERLERAENAKRDVVRAQAGLVALTDRRQELTGRLMSGRERWAERTQARDSLTRQVENDQARLAAARCGFESVAHRHLDLGQRISDLSRAAASRRVAQMARHTAASAASAFDGVLATSRFSDVDDYRAAKKPQAWIDMTAERVQTHAQRRHTIAEQLSAEPLIDLDESKEVDLLALTEDAERSSAAAQEAIVSHTAAARLVARAQVTQQVVRDAWQACERIEMQTQPIIRLATIATGGHGNLHGVKLATYVVKRRFCDVVDAANGHLADMSNGRYRLEVSDGPDGAERTYGLALNVYDDRTDQPRSPSTLSGGETFYVSLSLALGLADVVQSESGGITIETLFVDEGFGSLDSETLDTVMNVLSRLSRGHRTVGLISHVEEMKTRIPDRVEIHRPDPNGASQIKARTG